MRVETALRHSRALEVRLDDLFRAARTAGFSHKTILEEVQRIKDNCSVRWDRFPGWVRDRFYQRQRFLSDQLYMVVLHASSYERTVDGAQQGRDGEEWREIAPLAEYLRWQLRLDGKFVTFDEISGMTSKMSHDDRIATWRRVEGTYIWNHKPESAFSPWKPMNE